MINNDPKQCTGKDYEPDKDALVHVSGYGYLGFELTKEEAQRLHEIRLLNGWYSARPKLRPRQLQFI